VLPRGALLGGHGVDVHVHVVWTVRSLDLVAEKSELFVSLMRPQCPWIKDQKCARELTITLGTSFIIPALGTVPLRKDFTALKNDSAKTPEKKKKL
jgi:hypothetical protein